MATLRTHHTGPRVLLRRLREVMAERIGGQERLDKIVVMIAANMVAEVCSVYVLRADGVLELFSTEGLKHEAVHQTTMALGEGLVGSIAVSAEPLNLADAQAHPAFAYKPETGEEIYHSFMGVPILRAGRTLGVLVVQNRARRTYSEEEVEALQTVAMVIAEMVASGELVIAGRTGAVLDGSRPIQLEGRGLADGIGLGHVILHEPRIVVTAMIAEDSETEVQRLDDAMARLRLSVDDLLERREIAHHGEHRAILEAFRMVANDPGWMRRIREAVATGLTAEAAVERVQSDTRARLLRQTDPFIRERLNDFDDLANRLLRELSGKSAIDPANLPSDAIIVGRSMGAAELLDYDRQRLRGLVLEEGGPTSHVTIVAKAMGVPVVTQVAGIVSLAESGDAMIVDGETGSVHLRPPHDVERAYAEKVRFRARRQAQFRALRDRPAITWDGEEIELLLNAGLMVDMPNLDETGAKGIGLFRTELQFMVAPSLPRASEQQQLYERVIETAGPRPVTFRTLDIGGDKVLPYMRSIPEENPAMGWRALRLGLDRPGMLRLQVRALLKAAAGTDLKIMFPMVSDVAELKAARQIVEREMRYLRRHGHGEPSTVRLGAMLEVPSLLFDLDGLMTHADFVSVGSNDLFQFMMAADRGNNRLNGRYDILSPMFLRALRSIVEAAERHATPLTLCGEMAGRPIEAMALIGLGFRALSMSASSIGPVKAMLLDLNAGKVEERLLALLEDGASAGSLRKELSALAQRDGLTV